MFPLNFRAMHSLSLPAFQARVNQASPSTPSLLKVNVAMLNLFPHMPDNSWVRWISLMSISLKVYLRQFLSIRNQRIETRAQRWEQLPRSMTTSDCSLRVLAARTAQNVARLFPDRARNKLWIKSSPCRQQLSSKYWHLSSANVKVSLSISLQS